MAMTPSEAPQRRPRLTSRLAEAWRRRNWRPDQAAIAAFEGLRPFAVVTGASEGIGLALAHRIAAAGHDLLLVARRSAHLERAAAEIAARHGVEVLALPLNLTAGDAIARIDAALAASRAYADILVNSAGIGLAGEFAGHTEDEIERLVALNVAALTRLTRHYLPQMMVRGRGGVLNIASLGAFTPGPFQAAYYASKSYVLSLTEALAHEARGQGVRVCAACPGPVATGFHARMGSQAAWYRRIIPAASPTAVAAQAWFAYTIGLRLALPGVIAPVLAVALRLLPRRATLPIVAALLRPRP